MFFAHVMRASIVSPDHCQKLARRSSGVFTFQAAASVSPFTYSLTRWRYSAIQGTIPTQAIVPVQLLLYESETNEAFPGSNDGFFVRSRFPPQNAFCLFVRDVLSFSQFRGDELQLWYEWGDTTYKPVR